MMNLYALNVIDLSPLFEIQYHFSTYYETFYLVYPSCLALYLSYLILKFLEFYDTAYK